MIYTTGTILFAGWEFKQAIEWAKELNLTEDDVKIYKKGDNVYAMAKRDIKI